MYSQGKEEETIVSFFDGYAKEGRFLDIGAYDGKTFSNTLRLVELGWSGVCVEPAPSVFPKLIELHKNRLDRIELVNAAVGKDGWVEFYDSAGDAVSTSSPDHVRLWYCKGATNFTKYHLWSISINTLLERFGIDFDFINIDVEGTNLQLFNSVPWGKLTRLKAACIEHECNDQHMVQVLAQHGFEKIFYSQENIILTRKINA